MKTYIAPVVAARGDVVRGTLNGKSVASLETATHRSVSDMNLSFGL
jgi:hypothetical protein